MEVIEIDEDTQSESDEVMCVKELSGPLPKPYIKNTILPSTVVSPPDRPRNPFGTPNWSKRESPDGELSRGEQILKRLRLGNEDWKLALPAGKSKCLYCFEMLYS